ncbi:MAG: hypothetical protein HY906_10355 [Deltaproteobacteria bacterium]|nr:hypothetical protein [Deltaproteobacteria bacterium]
MAVWLADRLGDDGIDYAIGGALALGAHGAPRMTRDVDLSAFVPEAEIERLFDALERAGCLFRREEARRGVEEISLFRVRLGRVDVDVFVAFHPHHHEALGRRVRLAGPDSRLRWFLSAEDLAVLKLALFRGKDRLDLEALFAVKGSSLDLEYVRRWLHALTEPGDPRRVELERLVTRFVTPA